MGKRSGRVRAWMMEYAYLVTLGCMIAIVVCSAAYTMQLRRSNEEGIQAAAQAVEIMQTASPTHAPQVTPLPTIAPLVVRAAALSPGTAWPLEGKVLRTFDAQTPVYWEMLGGWRAHMGLDIAGEAGEAVLACADGEVMRCTWDELWGWRVIIRHEDGRESLYAGLEGCLVSEKARVRVGEEIGVLMEAIPCEAEMGTHLHLEMRREGKAADPEAILPER